jgi:hypothetical protein
MTEKELINILEQIGNKKLKKFGNGFILTGKFINVSLYKSIGNNRTITKPIAIEINDLVYELNKLDAK